MLYTTIVSGTNHTIRNRAPFHSMPLIHYGVFLYTLILPTFVFFTRVDWVRLNEMDPVEDKYSELKAKRIAAFKETLRIAFDCSLT